MNAIQKNIIPKDIDRKMTPLWYAIYVRSRYEKKVGEKLRERQVEYFLPLVPQLRQWKDRKKKVETPLFPGYVFVHIKLADRLSVLSIKGVAWLVSFQNQPAPIPESQINDVQRLLDYPELLEFSPHISEGDLVEITCGNLAGVQGRLIQYRGKQRILVGIELINQALSVEVDMSWVKPLKILS